MKRLRIGWKDVLRLVALMLLAAGAAAAVVTIAERARTLSDTVSLVAVAIALTGTVITLSERRSSLRAARYTKLLDVALRHGQMRSDLYWSTKDTIDAVDASDWQGALRSLDRGSEAASQIQHSFFELTLVGDDLQMVAVTNLIGKCDDLQRWVMASAGAFRDGTQVQALPTSTQKEFRQAFADVLDSFRVGLGTEKLDADTKNLMSGLFAIPGRSGAPANAQPTEPSRRH
jgi:hypothetical protein